MKKIYKITPCEQYETLYINVENICTIFHTSEFQTFGLNINGVYYPLYVNCEDEHIARNYDVQKDIASQDKIFKDLENHIARILSLIEKD